MTSNKTITCKVSETCNFESNTMQVELDRVNIISSCNKCISFKEKIVKFNQVIWKYEKARISLESLLRKQRYTKDISGLGFSKFDKSSSSKKTVFVNSSNAYNKVQPKKVKNNFQPKMTYVSVRPQFCP